MSKKSSIFVADLAIVPSVTCRNVKIMIRETICKVSIHDTIYKTNAIMEHRQGWVLLLGRASRGDVYAAFSFRRC